MPTAPLITIPDSVGQRLHDAAWLRAPGLCAVFDALESTGAVSRVVGGAVRNTLLGQPIDDVDLATQATPDQVLAALRTAGLMAIPTGLAHGTITAVADGVAYEVTTLRRDLTTDGRHATVAFTDDWALDASRRDFTINALYCDRDGMLVDPLGGAADLFPTRVRFIGDARTRIREDYLRILRFFRFSARYAAVAVDSDGLAACGLERGGLKRVSAERIRVEMMKLLSRDGAAPMCGIMQAHGFLVAMLGVAPSPGRLARLIAIEDALGLAADPIRRLAALALYPGGDTGGLAGRLRLSGAERDRLATIVDAWPTVGGPKVGGRLVTGDGADLADQRTLYRFGQAGFADAALVAWAGGPDGPEDAGWHRRLAMAAAWPVPKLPVGGKDALDLGCPPGVAVGRLLAAVEAWWIDAAFVPERAACLAELERLIKNTHGIT